MNNQDKVADLQRIIAIAQDDLALLMKNGKRFKPELDEEYWPVGDDGQTYCNPWGNDTFDKNVWKRFNCYETKELATKAAVMMRRNNAIIMACLMVDPNFMPNYLSGNQKHHSFCYQAEEMGVHGGWVRVMNYCYIYGPCVSTEAKWEKAAALLKEWGIE
jgi:hypothetical protein